MTHKLEAHEVSDACLKIMTDWWFDRFIGKDQYKDNGANDFNSVFAGTLGGQLADMHPVTEEQRPLFHAAFAAALRGKLPCSWTIDFGADYHPDGLLREAMDEVGIDHSRCPIKTNMAIGHDDQGSGVYLSAGYGIPFEFICDLQGVAPTCRQVCIYTTVNEAYKGHDDRQVEEKRDDRAFYAYDQRAWEEFRARDDWDSCPKSQDAFFRRYKVFVSEHTETRSADGEEWVTA